MNQWLLCVAMASIVLWANELRKLVNRALFARNGAEPLPNITN